MESHSVPEGCTEAVELLEPLVGSLVSASSSGPDTKDGIILRMNHAAWNLCLHRILSNVSIICFNSFAFVKHVFQGEPKDVDVWPISTRKGTNHPHNVPCADADSHFISDTWSFKLVTLPRVVMALLAKDPKVCSVHRNKAIIVDAVSRITDPSHMCPSFHRIDLPVRKSLSGTPSRVCACR